VGLYGYRTGLINGRLLLKKVETLEQLRVLWRRHKIHVGITDLYPGLSIDIEEELAKLEAIMTKGN